MKNSFISATKVAISCFMLLCYLTNVSAQTSGDRVETLPVNASIVQAALSGERLEIDRNQPITHVMSSEGVGRLFIPIVAPNPRFLFCAYFPTATSPGTFEKMFMDIKIDRGTYQYDFRTKEGAFILSYDLDPRGNLSNLKKGGSQAQGSYWDCVADCYDWNTNNGHPGWFKMICAAPSPLQWSCYGGTTLKCMKICASKN